MTFVIVKIFSVEKEDTGSISQYGMPAENNLSAT